MTEPASIPGADGASVGEPSRQTGPRRPSKPTATPKRTLTPGNFIRTIGNWVFSLPVLIRAFIRPKVPFVLREKLYLSVTAINDCRFCQWGHTHWALAHGLPLEEVNQILSSQDKTLAADNPAEAAAIFFAQHYAEQQDKFDPQALDSLRKQFNEAQIKELLAHVRFITLTNLSGNTVDAFLGRFRRPPQPVTVFQFVAGAVLAPILLLILLMAKLEQPLRLIKRRSHLHEELHDRRPDRGDPDRGNG